MKCQKEVEEWEETCQGVQSYSYIEISSGVPLHSMMTRVNNNISFITK